MKPTSRASSWPARSRFEGVARRRVRRQDMLAHSLAVLTPSLSALGTGLALPSIVGPGFWISTVAGFGLALIVASVLGEFAQRFASGGSLYTFTAKGLGASAALLVGVALLLGYGVLVGAGVTGAVERSQAAWGAVNGSRFGSGVSMACVVIVMTICVGIIAAGISIATRTALVIEAVSIVALTVVLGSLMWRFGLPHWGAMSLEGASLTRIVIGAALIASLTVAFESSATLGLEAERPMRDVPSAMRGGLLLTGTLFVAANAVGTVLPNSMSIWSFRWLGIGEVVSPLDAAVLLILASSYVALAFCAWNTLSRLIFSLAREGLLPRVLGITTRRGVPWPAVIVVVPLVMIGPLTRWLNGDAPTAGSWGMFRAATEIVSIAYGITAIALVSFLIRIDELRPTTTVKAAVALFGVLALIFERVTLESGNGDSSVFKWAAAVVLTAVAWRIAIARRLAVHRVLVGAHEEPLASDVVVPRAEDAARGTT